MVHSGPPARRPNPRRNDHQPGPDRVSTQPWRWSITPPSDRDGRAPAAGLITTPAFNLNVDGPAVLARGRIDGCGVRALCRPGPLRLLMNRTLKRPRTCDPTAHSSLRSASSSMTNAASGGPPSPWSATSSGRRSVKGGGELRLDDGSVARLRTHSSSASVDRSPLGKPISRARRRRRTTCRCVQAGWPFPVGCGCTTTTGQLAW
jgi:hypothetical protein